jgi:hypothetical protein
MKWFGNSERREYIKMKLCKLINAILYSRAQHLPRYTRHKKSVFQKTRGAVTGVWRYLVVTFVSASWITAYLMSKKLYSKSI